MTDCCMVAMTALCPWAVLPEEIQSHSEATMGKGWGRSTWQKAHHPQTVGGHLLRSLVSCWGSALKALALVPLSWVSTMRSQNREQRVAVTKTSPTVLLCTICCGPSNAIHWAGQEGITLGITEVGATCAPRVWTLPPARKKPLPMDIAPSDHSLCPALRFSEFLLLLSKETCPIPKY